MENELQIFDLKHLDLPLDSASSVCGLGPELSPSPSQLFLSPWECRSCVQALAQKPCACRQ